MHFSTYQALAMRTRDKNNTQQEEEILACMGIAGEAGEFIDLVKKMHYHKKVIEVSDLKKEMGDILWYIALFCKANNWDMEEIAELNIQKLAKRYPIGFTYEAANNRVA